MSRHSCLTLHAHAHHLCGTASKTVEASLHLLPLSLCAFLTLLLLLLTPPIAIFTLCTCKRNCTNGIISCFLPASLLRELRRISFCFVCRFDLLSFWIPTNFSSFRVAPCRAPPCLCTVQIKLEQESRLLTACLPAPSLLALLLACLTALAAFHLSLRRSHSSLSLARRIRSQLQRNQSKERHTSASPSPLPSLSSSSQPQNEQNFFVFLWGVSNNF